MSRILARIKKESIEAIPAIIYFCIAFNIIHFGASLARQPGDIKYYTAFGITIIALLVGKIIVVVNCFSFINAFPRKPIIYNIIWKLLVYNFFIIIARIMEMLFHLTYKYKNVPEVMQGLLREVTVPVFWSSEIYLVFVFFSYVVASEFVRVLGKEKVKKIIFG